MEREGGLGSSYYPAILLRVTSKLLQLPLRQIVLMGAFEITA